MRQSPNILGDIRRGWSAWAGCRAETLEGLIAVTPDFDEYDIAEAWESWDGDDRQAFLLDYCEQKAGTWVPRYDEAAGQWCWWHHNGLACYGLEAETVAEALVEARASGRLESNASGQGDMTVGNVSIVADLGNNWYLLACDDYTPEP